MFYSPSSLPWFINRILGRTRFIKNLYGTNFQKNAVFIYKTSPFTLPKNKLRLHPNNTEILETTRLLNSLKYNIDLYDRTINPGEIIPLKNCDILLTILGGGGRPNPKILKILNPTKLVSFVYNNPFDYAKSQYDLSYLAFSNRWPNIKLKKLREISNDDMDHQEFMISKSDLIITNNLKFQILHPKLNIKNITFPLYEKYLYELNSNINGLNGFLVSSGSGVIEKGIDIVLEAFAATNLKLHLLTVDKSIFSFVSNAYGSDFLSKNNNIKIYLKVDLAGPIYKEIVNKCRYVINASPSESGFATGTLRAMLSGLIPVTISMGEKFNSDFELSSNATSINEIKKFLQNIGKLGINFNENSFKAKEFSSSYTKYEFNKLLSSALNSII
jgi:hypothetical protein